MKVYHAFQDLLDSTTDATDRLNLEFFTGELKTFIDGFPFHGFYFPVSYLEGVQVMKILCKFKKQKVNQWHTDVISG